MKKASNILIRLLCGCLDFLVVMIPVQFVMMGIFQVSTGQADLLFKLLSAVYATLFTEYWGKTPGKYFGRLRVVDESGQKPVMLYLGLRELTKTLYFVPYVGAVLLAVSLVMMFVRKDGRALHDFVGNTRVVFAWQLEEE